MNFLLALGSLIFLISSIYFLFFFKKKFNSAFFVSFITLISYLVMLEGSFVISNLFWTRWLGYAFSCSLLIFVISKKLSLSFSKQINNVLLNILVMVTGALASVNTNEIKWLFFIISSLAYAKIVYEIFSTKSKKLKTIGNYIIYGWSVFPVVVLISNEGLNFIQVELSTAIYLILDFFTKIIIYIKNKDLIVSSK